MDPQRLVSGMLEFVTGLQTGQRIAATALARVLLGLALAALVLLGIASILPGRH